MAPTRSSRRQLLKMGVAAGGSLLASREARAADGSARELGAPLGPYSERSPFEKAVRFTRPSKTPETGSSFTPIQDSVGTLTPSALHYERHHSGIPTIDLIDLHDYPQWHTKDDDLEHVSARSLQIVGDVLLASLPEIEKRLLQK